MGLLDVLSQLTAIVTTMKTVLVLAGLVALVMGSALPSHQNIKVKPGKNSFLLISLLFFWGPINHNIIAVFNLWIECSSASPFQIVPFCEVLVIILDSKCWLNLNFRTYYVLDVPLWNWSDWKVIYQSFSMLD